MHGFNTWAGKLNYLARWSALLVALGVLLSGCAEQEQPAGGDPRSRPMPVVVQLTVAETVVERVPAVGSLMANESIILRAEIAGLIDTINFEEGTEVSAGELLVRLNADEHQALVEQTQATVKLAQLSFARATDLLRESMISRQELDEAQARLKESQAALRRNQAVLAKTRLLAPFSGTIGLRHVSPGAYIQPGQDLANLEDIDPIKVEFKLSERYAGAIATGKQLEVAVDALPGQIFSGTIYAINPRLDPRTRAFSLRARIPNDNGHLRPGMFARVNLIVDRRDNAITVPEQSIWPQGDQAFVYRVVEGKAALTRVELGERFDGKVEIRSGLIAKEPVIISGHMKIRDGSAVANVGAAATGELPKVTAGPES